MQDLKQRIESLLFIAGKPLSVKKLAEMANAKPKDVAAAADELLSEYATSPRGIQIMRVDDTYQMATSPSTSGLIESFIKHEQTGELTKPSLETLTIVAYRGPISKGELEQIRGVNCSLILRNLLIKGLVEASFDRKRQVTVYQITLAFLEFLGVRTAEELPDYQRLHDDAHLAELLRRQLAESAEAQIPAPEKPQAEDSVATVIE